MLSRVTCLAVLGAAGGAWAEPEVLTLPVGRLEGLPPADDIFARSGCRSQPVPSRSPAQVPDPRKRRGIRHSLAGLLAVGVAAVTAGARSFAAIGQWAADAGPEALAALGAARGPAEESTFRRAFALVSAGRARPGPRRLAARPGPRGPAAGG